MTIPKLTVNRQCSRCPRVEQTEVSVADVVNMAKAGKNELPVGPKALSMVIDGKPLAEFPFLCSPCVQIVARYVEHIVKKPKHQSALRGEQKIEVETE